MKNKNQDELIKAIEGLGTDFKFVRELGRGATAIVYLVEDRELGRNLAVKVIRSSFIHDDEAMARLQREARLVAQMQHPHIVSLFDTRHLADGSMVLLMEHVPGRNLREVIQDVGALKQTRALAILKEVASALAYAHRRRIVHRDVKPENIYIDEEIGTARLADFGVARPWDRDARLTLPGESLGTPAYMSPEQIDAEEIDGRSDVYSLGLVGYELLVGRHPWESENLYSIIFKQKHEELPPLHSLRPNVSSDLVQVLAKALQKEPDNRWESAEELLTALEAIDVSEPMDPLFDVLESAEGSRARGGLDPNPIDWGAIAGEIRPVEAWDVTETREKPKRKRRLALLLTLPVLLVGGTYAWLARTPGGLPWASGDIEALSSAAPGPETSIPDPALLPPTTPASTASVVVVGGERQEGEVGTALPLPLTVQVLGPDGTAVADTAVIFRIMAGEGTLDTEEVHTDSLGTASTSLRLPDRAGRIVVTAGLYGADTVLTGFDVAALPGPPSEIEPIRGGGQRATVGQRLPERLTVRVIDALGNPVPQVAVLFAVQEGGGRLNPASVQTDSLGIAGADWRLGSTEGPQVATASVPAAGNVTERFLATADAEPAASEPDPLVVVDDAPPPPQPLSMLRRSYSIGGRHVCLLDGRGRLRCRGADDRGQISVASDVIFESIAAGVEHTCGLDSQAAAWCWGANAAGQLGNGSRIDMSAPSPVDTDALFSVLAAGHYHTCALDTASTAYCWGRNVAGQVGDGTRDSRSQPRRVITTVLFSRLAVGWNHSCAAELSGQVWCWGLNTQGQLGDGTREDRLSPVRVDSSVSFEVLAAGNAHTCGLGGGQVFCWGDNGFGQLGLGTTQLGTTPSRVDLPGAAVGLTAGANHTCALLGTGAAYCWGQNTFGQLGEGTNTDRSSPELVRGNYRFDILEAGGGVTCGVRPNPNLVEFCWGFNQNGQLGDGTRTSRSTPTPVSG